MTDPFSIGFAFSFWFAVLIVPARQRSAEHDEDLLTGRTEQFQQGNTRGSDPVHAGPAGPTEYKHGTPDRADRVCKQSPLWALFRKLDVIAGQLELELIFNEAEALTETLYVVESTEEDVIQVRCRKRKGKREEDLKDLPAEVTSHTLPEKKLLGTLRRQRMETASR